MYKIAPKIFVLSSIIFGFVGILVVLTSPETGESSSSLNTILVKTLMVTVFVILPSFALSVAGKYLDRD